MNKKTVVAISLGIFFAALICLIAGIICYFTAKHNAIAFLIGLFMIFTGAIMAAVAVVVLLAVLVMTLISKSKK